MFSDTAFAPPSNIEAEQALLGALLCKNSSYESIAGLLQPEHFYDEMHGRVFASIEKGICAGQRVNPVTLKRDYDHKFLAQLAGSAISTSNNKTYATVIREAWQRRELAMLAGDLTDQAHKPGDTLDDLREKVDKRLSEIFRGSDARDLEMLGESIEPTLAGIERAWKFKGQLIGVTTGLADVDKALGGLMAGELYVLAGRPGMGKSTAAKTVALAAARAGKRVAYFSLEMDKKQLLQWFIADATGISATRQRTGDLVEHDLRALFDAAQEFHALPIHIDDTPALAMAQIRTRVRRLKRQQGLDLIVIDHIQLLKATREAQRAGSVQALTEITGDLKTLAKDMDCPVLALSQLSRAVESRDDKRPMLSDLRESGSIEQDADVVMFCYRDEYYLEKQEPRQRAAESAIKYQERRDKWLDAMNRVAGQADVIIAKYRSGRNASIRVRFEPDHARMSDWSRW